MSSTCTDPQDFPLIGNSLCVAPTSLTAIFLASIITAGVSFLILIGFLIFFYKRRSSSPHAKYYNDDKSLRSDTSHNDESILSDITYSDDDDVRLNRSTPRTDRKISHVLKKIIDTNPSSDSIQASIHRNLTIPKSQASLSSSYKSYIGLHRISEPSIGTQRQQTDVISTQSSIDKSTISKANKLISTIPDQTDNTSEYENIVSSRF
ncbi:unnamed protein product [Rotaria sp. Silwood2]|nr:unnamed protein product [Rotaria sp. Silwood2]CAF2556278.1 unnamed protein product [Rotaria sp. Silwood2]CAF2818708.1 unnamed protein product [Rotaria sp. Silwood2]CAF3851488.1 unnamed protein product [Rotaria sp. Silwood2]CAF3867619.1 unnamed protein product [Rotaria sp. Silwood2]